jgi:uncharacterized protein YeeX (DUF496 family)
MVTTLKKESTYINDELSFEELLEIKHSKQNELYPSNVVDFIIDTREKYEK